MSGLRSAGQPEPEGLSPLTFGAHLEFQEQSSPGRGIRALSL